MKTLLTLITSMAFFIAAAQAVNDEPCTAITLNVADTDSCTPATVISWVGATANINTPVVSCFGSYVGDKKDVWYKFVVPNSGYIIIKTAVGATMADYTMSLYAASTCTTGFVPLVCDDDSGPDAYPMINYGGLTPGSTCYIRIWAWSTPINNGELKICLNAQSLATGRVGIGTNTPVTTLDVNGSIKIRGGNPAPGRKLTTDAFGNATWAETVTQTGWLSSAGLTTKDSIIDGTCMRVMHLPVPQLTQEVLTQKQFTTYFRVGSIGPCMLPYISDAGGATNQISCIYAVGKVIIYRHTFKSCRYTNAIAESYPGEPVMIILPLSLEYKVVINN